MIFGRFRRLHFVGIGGAGMSGMAEILADLGYAISGSDNTPSEVTEHLQTLGIAISQSHRAENVADAHLLVISAAVDESNPEIIEARSRGIPVIKRAEMLGELMRLKYSIGIAGAHGKTSTTALCGHILKGAGLDPTVIVGGRLTDASLGSKIGSSEYLVAEADEYDRSFLVMYPTVAVATNLEEDHCDCYRDLADLQDAFCEYFNRTPFYGQIILNADDDNLMELVPRLKRPVVTFGFSADADYRAIEGQATSTGTKFSIVRKDKDLGEFIAPSPGKYNIYNALCAAVIAFELDAPSGVIAEALRSFPGVLRRFELKGEAAGRLVYDDYAHHPTEVAAAVQGARIFERPLTVIFQPHLFSRTRDFAGDFAEALSAADRVIVTDIYPAREKPIAGVTSELIVSAAEKKGYANFQYVGEMTEALTLVVKNSSDRELIMTMGAGNICRICDPLLSELEKSNR